MSQRLSDEALLPGCRSVEQYLSILDPTCLEDKNRLVKQSMSAGETLDQANDSWSYMLPRRPLPENVLEQLRRADRHVLDFWMETEELHLLCAIQPGEKIVTDEHQHMVRVLYKLHDWNQVRPQFLREAKKTRIITFDVEKTLTNKIDKKSDVALILLGTLGMQGFAVDVRAISREKKVTVDEILGDEIMELLRDPSVIVLGTGLDKDIDAEKLASELDTSKMLCALRDHPGALPRETPETVWKQEGLHAQSVAEWGWHLKPLGMSNQARDLQKSNKWKLWGFRWPYHRKYSPDHRRINKLYDWPKTGKLNTQQYLYICEDIWTPLFIARRWICWSLLQGKYDRSVPVEDLPWHVLQCRRKGQHPSPPLSPVLSLMASPNPSFDGELSCSSNVPLCPPLGSSIEQHLEIEDDPGVRCVLRDLLRLVVEYPRLERVACRAANSYGVSLAPWIFHTDRGGSSNPSDGPWCPGLSLALDRPSEKMNSTREPAPHGSFSYSPSAGGIMTRLKQEAGPFIPIPGYCRFCGLAYGIEHPGRRAYLECKELQAQEEARTQGFVQVLCKYPLCTDRTRHHTSVCTTLVHLCQICHRRGHTEDVCPEDIHAQEDTFQDLLHLFERFANFHRVTRLRQFGSHLVDELGAQEVAGRAPERSTRVNLALGFVQVPINLERNCVTYQQLLCGRSILEAEECLRQMCPGWPEYDPKTFMENAKACADDSTILGRTWKNDLEDQEVVAWRNSLGSSRGSLGPKAHKRAHEESSVSNAKYCTIKKSCCNHKRGK